MTELTWSGAVRLDAADPFGAEIAAEATAGGLGGGILGEGDDPFGATLDLEAEG